MKTYYNHRKLLRSSGFALTEVMIIAAILAVLTLASMGILTDMFKFQKRVEAKDFLRNMAVSYRDAIAMGRSWTKTKGHPTNASGQPGITALLFNCLNGLGAPATNGNLCGLGGHFELDLHTITDRGPPDPAPPAPPSVGTPLYNFTTPARAGVLNLGFNITPNGTITACNTFVPSPGAPDENTNCPFSINFRAKGDCNLPLCSSPIVTVEVTFSYNPNSASLQRYGPIDVGNYRIAQVAGTGTVQSTSDLCSRFLNGVYDPGADTCTLRNDNGDTPGSPPNNCSNGQFLMRDVASGRNVYRCTERFDKNTGSCANNTAIAQLGSTFTDEVSCSPKFATANQDCPAGQVQRGTNDDGTPKCTQAACRRIRSNAAGPGGFGTYAADCSTLNTPDVTYYAAGGGGNCGFHLPPICGFLPGLITMFASFSTPDPPPGNPNALPTGWQINCDCFSAVIGYADAICCPNIP